MSGHLCQAFRYTFGPQYLSSLILSKIRSKKAASVYCNGGHFLLIESNINITMSSFKSHENTQMKENGPDRCVSNNKFSSVTMY